MSDIIMVPIHLDGLLLTEDTIVTESFVDFSELPFTKNGTDHNPDTANLSESILSLPLQDTNLSLKKGMHLHWSLPDALTKGGASGTIDDYLAVPNRWLIVRYKNNTEERRWVVESDYLYADPTDPTKNVYDAIAYPLDDEATSGLTFGYLGRQLDGEGWTEDSQAERLSKLTALGYGEPAFAAFYPNCYSVFGCFDPDVDTQSDLADLSYQIIGWYSDSAQDPFAQYLAENPGADAAAIKNQFSWNVDMANSPQGMACYAQLGFDANTTIESTKKENTATVSIGNTGTEALSAYMTNHLNTNNSDYLEEQLENLFLEAQLQDSELDMGPRFEQARHQQGFKATKGGSLWEIRTTDSSTASGSSGTLVSIGLPATMSDALDELNAAQLEKDQAANHLIQQRQILFTDWYKYMLCAYPPDDTRDDYPDIDYVKWYIQTNTLVAVKEAETDLTDKQTALDALTVDQSELQTQIGNFNNSTLPQELLYVPLDADTNDLSSVTITGTEVWSANKPFSESCLDFDGEGSFSIAITPNADVKALSLWAYIATQNTDEGTLLATQSSGIFIGKSEINNLWDSIAIDGVVQPTYQDLEWTDLPKDQWFHLHIEFSEVINEALYLFHNNGSEFLTGKLAAVRLFSEGLSEDEIYYDQNMLGHEEYQLKEGTAPRFWEPAEPVLLIAGDAVEPTLRYGQDGRLNADNSLDCLHTDAPSGYPIAESDLAGLISEVNTNAPASGEEKIGYDTWSEQPWHPFLLEWKVEVKPMLDGGNLDINNKDFDTDFLTANYSLLQDEPKLDIKEGKTTTQAVAIFSGRSILTPYAKTRLIKTTINYLNNLTVEECYHALNNTSASDAYNEALLNWYDTRPTLDTWYASTDDYKDALASYKLWYIDKPVLDGSFVDSSTYTKLSGLTLSDQVEDFTYALIVSFEDTLENHVISQALSGFNNAMLMQHQTLQLPVSDPLGFADHQTFTDLVQSAIGTNTNIAPLALNDFLPIRSGEMQILELQVIDSFGQVKTVDTTDMVKAVTLDYPDDNTFADEDSIYLPPRFVQPARINFRWLSAESGSKEFNAMPESTPICGWLMANHLDNSIAVYDQQGSPLGYIDQEAQWRSIPGTDATINPSDFENQYLQGVIERLALIGDEVDTNQEKQNFLQNFITVTDSSLEAIDPDSFIHHLDLALLMGRPIAVVRASVDLQLKGSAAIHHGWTEFIQDMTRSERETNSFEDVIIPIRIGERSRLNDGALGYWVEQPDGTLNTVFHSTADLGTLGLTNNDGTYTIDDHNADDPTIQQSFNAGADTLTLLIDPRSTVHATTGILPTKGIGIPKPYFSEALRNINITFLSTPIIMAEDQTAIPVPNETGYQWSWLSKDRYNWTEATSKGLVRKDTLVKTFENGEAIWDDLLDKGWIIAIDGNRANIVSTDQRTSTELGDAIKAQTFDIQAVLDAGHIVPVNTQAVFTPDQTIKEGWLKLSPADE